MRATKVSVGFIAFIVLFVAAVNSSVLALSWSISFETLLSEFVVVLCSTLSMLVKARWASPIHSLAAASAASTASGFVRACEKLCDVARLSVRLRALRMRRFLACGCAALGSVLEITLRDQCPLAASTTRLFWPLVKPVL